MGRNNQPVKITLVGEKDLDKRLSGMQGKAGNRVARNTLGAGARVVLKAIKAIAPPSIKMAIGMRNERSKTSRLFESKVGVNVGKRGRTQAKRWAPLIVLGSQRRQRKMIGGKFSFITKPTNAQLSTGHVKATNIVKRGYASAQGSMNSAMRKAFERSVKREAARAKLNK